jgi:hypothetical protein
MTQQENPNFEKCYYVFFSVPYVIKVKASSEEEAISRAEEIDISEYFHDTSDGSYKAEEICNEYEADGAI